MARKKQVDLEEVELHIADAIDHAPAHKVDKVKARLIAEHYSNGMDIDRLAALTMLSKSEVQKVIASL
jgi:hypothetical protein